MTLRCRSKTYPSFLVNKTLHIRLGPLGPHCTKVHEHPCWRLCLHKRTTATMENTTKQMFFVCHCRRAWGWWSGRGDAKFERRDGHSADLAGATTNSDGKRRTVGDRKRQDVSPQQTVAVGGYTARRPRVARTATMATETPQKAQPIREPFRSGTDATKGVAVLQ